MCGEGSGVKDLESQLEKGGEPLSKQKRIK